MITKITHLTLFVTSQDEALKFYTEKFGFKVHTDANFQGFRWLTINLPTQPDVEVALMPATTAEEKACVGKQGCGKPFMSFESTDCQADYEQLSKAGVTILDKPKTEPWGTAMAIADLYGNMLYVCQPAKY